MRVYVIPGLLLAGTLFFTYLYLAGPAPGNRPLASAKKSKKGSVSYDRLQNLRQGTQVHLDLKRQQAIMEQRKERPMLDPDADEKSQFHQTDLNSDLGPAADVLDSSGSVQPATMDQRVDEFLAKKQAYEEMQKTQKRAYIKAFIRETQKMGYDVKVDPESMEILSVKQK